MTPKRKAGGMTLDEVLESENLDERLLNKLMEIEPENLALILGHIANRSNLTNAQFKKARTAVPSFSKAKWNLFAEQFSLPESAESLKLEPFNTPFYCLPPSFHEPIFEAAWRVQDVYRERMQQKEEARVRILDPVCRRFYYTPLCYIFTTGILCSILSRFWHYSKVE
jgi:hypothetical protein